MTELTAEEARRLSRIIPSVPIEKYVHAIDNAIREAAGKGHFEIPVWRSLGPWTLTDAELRAIKSHYENKGFEFVLMETTLSWKEVREMPEPAEFW